jgi:nitronate monooxygenase
MPDPVIIQGGMGVGVSNWNLARAVSMTGQLGVVSGTALDMVFVRRLQLGDAGGHIRRALTHFPLQEWVGPIWERYFIPGGKSKEKPFKLAPQYSLKPSTDLLKLTILANFVEVFLAKEGHPGLVGINFLEKIQLQTLPSILGAMLASVDYVLMGAGIPRAIPGILDQLAEGNSVELAIDVHGALPGESFKVKLDREALGMGSWKLKRPKFLAIISSATLAIVLARKSNGRIDGFVVEGATAGGHNAPPRGKSPLNERGEPVYGERDNPEIYKILELGLPFWLAGSFSDPQKVREAIQMGATGVQIGTAFAFCRESGIRSDFKTKALGKIRKGTADIFTDPIASPTGFPFKVLQMEDSISEKQVYEHRGRVCDLGYLRHAYRKNDGSLGYRCPGEPVESYARKGGNLDDTIGRKCICNGLAATIGLAQIQADQQEEKPLFTAGNDIVNLTRLMREDGDEYAAEDVVRYLLSEI